ncbi:MAG: tetratricopeptide repeat protein, partial [Smithella sp.]
KKCYEKALAADFCNIEAIIKIGHILELQGDYHNALEQYTRAIEIAPQDAEPRFCLATLYDRHDMYDEAEEEYENIIEINPKHTKALHNLGRIHFQNGDYAKASKNFHSVLKIDPENTDALNDLGSVYEITNNVIQAISAYRKALKINPLNEETNYNLANAYFSVFLSNPNIVNIEDIVERLQFVLSQNPNNKKVRELLNKVKVS